MLLHYREFGQGPPLMILHGLFGSGRNWQGMARALAADHRVITPDLRNHGHSPHTDAMSYHALAADIIELARHLGLQEVLLLGHSMGGKVAMTAALTAPEYCRACIIADIAPVNYTDDLAALARAMRDLPLARIKDRGEAEAELAASISDVRLRQFMLQNLARAGNGFRWRVNLAGILSQLDSLRAFPASLRGKSSGAPGLFIGGAESDYSIKRDKAAILRYFPAARIKMIEGAGHWLHADKPAEFLHETRSFMQSV